MQRRVKQSRINPVSPERARRRKVAREQYADCHGITLADLWRHLPQTADEWRALKVHRVDSVYVLARFQCMVKDWRCWLCPTFSVPQIHHICGGTKGRSDELANLFLACQKCHERIQSSRELLPEVLLAKFKNDRASVDWVRICLLMGRRCVPESFTE